MMKKTPKKPPHFLLERYDYALRGERGSATYDPKLPMAIRNPSEKNVFTKLKDFLTENKKH